MESPREDISSLEPSSVVGDTYRIDEFVAHGGSSVIYSARHVEMDRRVALKVLPLETGIDASALERFSQEARIACQINHPNVVTIYQFGQDARGLLYIAMEWLDGLSLSDAIEQRDAFSPLRVAQIGREIARGLAAVHDRDILHRDLKPSNVMLAELADWEEIAKLLDFGVAKSLGPTEEDEIRITQEGKFVGTPRYAAPELIRGEELTPRTDIYSVGLLTWEALTGEPAVSSVVFQKCCAQHLSDDPWQLPDSVDCPPALADVIHKSLRKDPAERFETCRDLARALGDAVHEIASGDRSSRSAPVVSGRADRDSYGSHWMKLLFAVAVGAAVLGLAGYQGWLSVTESSTPSETRVSEAVGAAHSPDELIDRLEGAGWSVTDRDSTPRQPGDQYRLERLGADATLTVSVEEGASSSAVNSLGFPGFTVHVGPDDSAKGSPATYQLLADLYAIRAETSDADSAE